MPKFNEGIITRTIWLKYGQGQISSPNIFYYAFESDLLILRNTGTVVEYEIKLSVSDFKNGLKKKAFLHGSDKRKTVKQTHYLQKPISRYKYLKSGYGANMFYYVMPAEVAEKVEIPEWAGLIHARPWRKKQCILSVMKKPKYLHRKDPHPDLKEKLLIACYYKFWQHHAIKNIQMVRTK